jgi:condensin-2 complex subunit D3
MEDIKEEVLAFIDVCAGNDNLEEQERLCTLLLNEVSSFGNKNEPQEFNIRTNLEYNNKKDLLSVRNVLGNLNSETINKFAMSLSDMMAHRVDPSLLMPPTQDAQANDEALTTSAITLTRHSFLAAKLYSLLLAMPGSWGAGLIDVGALSNLSALIRRWCVECTFSEAPELKEKGKRKGSASTAAPFKKKRPNENYDDDEDSAFEHATDDNDDPSGMITSPLSLRLAGLDLAKAFSQIPAQADFLHWSEDATEVVLDAVVCCFMTVAALRGKNDLLSCEPVVQELSQSLTACAKNLASASALSEEDDDDDVIVTTQPAKSRTTMVFILRGIFSVLSLKIEVPNGQKGKEVAHAAGVKTLESIISVVSKELEKTFKEDYDASKTPAEKATKSTDTRVDFASPNAPTPRTGRKDRKKRVSFGNVRGRSIERITAPTLKEANTPLRNKARASAASAAVGNPILHAVVGMLQKLVTLKDLDRSDVRKHTMAVLTTCLPVLPLAERSRFLRFLIQMCHSKVSVHRLAGIELVGKVLSQSWFWEHHVKSIVDMGGSPNKSPLACAGDTTPRALLRCLNGRLSDKAPAVRARAASSLVEILNIMEEENKGISTDNKKDFNDSIEAFLHEIMGQLRQRAQQDDRATVRKAAIVALSKLSTYCKTVDIDDQDVLMQIHNNIELFGRLCNDTSVAARKSAADALTELLLLEYSSDTNPVTDTKFLPAELAWTSSVLPLVLDAEPTCVNNAVELFYQVVVSPLIENKDGAWRILACVSECTEQQGATKGEYEALCTAVRKLTELDDDEVCIGLFNRVRDAALSSTNEHESSDANFSAVWCLLQALTDQNQDLAIFFRWVKRKSVGHAFITDPLQRMFEISKSSDFEEASSVHASLRSGLRVVSKLAAYLPTDEAEKIVSALKEMLGELYMGPEVIGAGVTAMIECLRRSVPDQDLRSECASLVDELYKKCEDEISNIVSALGKGANYVDQNDEPLARAVYLCGELAMVGFRSDEGGSAKETDSSDPIIGLSPKPSTHLLNMIQALLPKTLPGDKVATPEPARAHAFVTLGKFCLREERFAKECLNLFARELHQNLAEPCIAVQSNALLVLGDLCIKYTNLVDRHVPVMAACLQAGVTVQSDNSFLVGSKSSGTALVRKHAVLMLAGLLLQDYIKWRGLMFHRFLVACSDSDDGVASLAEMTLCGPLLTKNPKLFLNNFVESLLVLNKCTAHPIYMAAACAGDNGAGIAVGFDGIDLSGATGQARRYHMYRMMLSKMSDEEKIGVSARLSKDILGAAVQSEGDLGRVCRAHSGKTNNVREEAAFDVLSDAFHILTSPWLRVGRAGTSTAEDDDVEDPNVTTGKSAKLAVAKGRLLSNISRKQMVEIILPILCNLKSILQTSCSPLLKELMTYLAEMFRAYKTEVKEFLANDPSLLQEVEYDAKKFRKSQGAASSGVTLVEDSPVSS